MGQELEFATGDSLQKKKGLMKSIVAAESLHQPREIRDDDQGS